MKVYIDQTPVKNGHAGRGIGHYTRMLVEALRQHPAITLVDSMAAAEVIHYPYFDLFFLTLPAIHKPTIVTIHDVIPLLYPREYPRGLRGAIKLMLQTRRLSHINRIVTDSDRSTTDVIRWLHQPPAKVQTVYLAVDPGYQPAAPSDIESVRQKYHLDKPYFLYVGDINYNKNLPALLEAFKALPEEYLLVLVSKTLRRDNPAAAYLWQRIDALGIEKRLRILTAVPQEPLNEMKGLYSGALWYVQPSLYEGFGLPVLEAQACGTPVISSIGGSLAEIAGNSTWEFNPTHINELQEALLKSLKVTREEKLTLVEKGFINLKRFSWEKTADIMAQVYETVA